MEVNAVLNEQNPFLREIWALGYDKVVKEPCTLQLKLIRSGDRYIKVLPMFKLTDRFTIKESILVDGQTHKWLSDADGSCERFRNIIAPDSQ